MSQYFVLVKLYRERFRQHPDIMPRTYPSEHHPLEIRPHLPDSPISPPLSPPLSPRLFPSHYNDYNNFNFEIIGVYSSREHALNFLNSFDRIHLERYRIFGPFELNRNPNHFRTITHEEDPNFYIN